MSRYTTMCSLKDGAEMLCVVIAEDMSATNTRDQLLKYSVLGVELAESVYKRACERYSNRHSVVVRLLYFDDIKQLSCFQFGGSYQAIKVLCNLIK